MTPDPVDHQPYTTPTDVTRCSVAGCDQGSETLSLFAGRRCRIHRDHYSPAVASALAATGWEDTLSAYRRNWQK